MKNYYKELPEGFKQVKVLDSIENKKYAKWLNTISIGIMIVFVFIIYSLRFTADDTIIGVWESKVHLIFFLLVLVADLICHSLLHGLVYRLLTGAELKIGAGGNLIYCGIPGTYVNRKVAVLSFLAPFVVFSVLFFIATVLTDGYTAMVFVFAFAIHIGTCASDFYNIFLIVFRYRGDILINDMGTKQVYYQYRKIEQ